MAKKIDEKQIRVAVIGGGKISEQHLSVLKRLHDVNIVGVCDLSPALASFTAKRFKVSNWYTDYDLMLRKCEPDVIHVLTPPATHNRIVRDCLKAGAHVIVEKPVALSNHDFQALWNLAGSKKLRLIENHNYRFNRPVRELQQIIKGGKIGTLREVEVRLVLNIRDGGRYADQNFPHPSHLLPAGVIHEFITHLSYLLLLFMPDRCINNNPIYRAAWRNHGCDNLFKYDDLDATIIAGDVHGRIRFSSNQWPDSFTIQVRGDNGIANAELFHPNCIAIRPRAVGHHLTPLANSVTAAGSMLGAGLTGIWDKIRNRDAYEGLIRFLELSYQALWSGGEPPVTYRQMDETSQLVDSLLARENSI